jgi:hypothetical protein
MSTIAPLVAPGVSRNNWRKKAGRCLTRRSAAARARRQVLCVIVGGPAETFAASDVPCDEQERVPCRGSLINNMLSQIATVAIAEALVFGKKAGLDPKTSSKGQRGHPAESWNNSPTHGGRLSF